jgi:hypothetical protein
MSWTWSTHGEIINAYTNLVKKPEGKRPHGGPGGRSEDETDLKETGREVDSTGSGYSALVSCHEHSTEPLKSKGKVIPVFSFN